LKDAAASLTKQEDDDDDFSKDASDFDLEGDAN
jgi:hypothetical protein